MASIQQVKGRWYGLVRDPETGKRTSIPLGDSELAATAWKQATDEMEQRFRQASRERQRRSEQQSRAKGVVSIQDALRAFVGFLECRTTSRTLRQYQGHARCLERLLPIKKPIHSFGLADVDKFIRARLGEGVDPRTIAKEQAFLRRFVRFLHERWHEAVPRDWSGGSSLKSLSDSAGGVQNKRRRAHRPVLTLEQVQALLAALPPETRLGARVRFLLYCPVRPCEMLRLQVADVDLEHGSVSIRIRKNGRKGGERVVPYPIVKPLRAILETATAGKHPEATVFPRPSDNREQTTDGLCQEWRNWRKQHAALADVQLYALRRTVGTAADRTATNSIVAMGVLNHRTWQAHSHYSELGTEDARKALEDALSSLGVG